MIDPVREVVRQPFYPKPGNGRPPVGVERMLRLYFLQHWFNLSDPAVEEALYDSQAMRHDCRRDHHQCSILGNLNPAHKLLEGIAKLFGIGESNGCGSRSRFSAES
jgi:hypothetical protein